MFNECGVVINRWKKFLTSDMKSANGMSKNESEKLQCLRKHVSDWLAAIIPDKCHCPLACNEIDIDARIPYVKGHMYRRDEQGYYWTIRIQYKNKRIKQVTEIPAYTTSDFLAEVGGLVGLLVGMSLLSVVEFVVYLIASVGARL